MFSSCPIARSTRYSMCLTANSSVTSPPRFAAILAKQTKSPLLPEELLEEKKEDKKSAAEPATTQSATDTIHQPATEPATTQSDDEKDEEADKLPKVTINLDGIESRQFI